MHKAKNVGGPSNRWPMRVQFEFAEVALAVAAAGARIRAR